MQSNPEIEEGTKTSLKIKAYRVKGSKVFVKISDPKISLSDTAVLDIDNPEMCVLEVGDYITVLHGANINPNDITILNR